MAIQILPNTGIGEKLGSSLGSGIQQALGFLIKDKLDALRGAREYDTMRAVLGDAGGAPTGRYIRPGSAPQYARLAQSKQKEVRRQTEKMQPVALAKEALPAIKELIASGKVGSGWMPTEAKAQYQGFVSALKESKDPALRAFSGSISNPDQGQQVIYNKLDQFDRYLTQILGESGYQPPASGQSLQGALAPQQQQPESFGQPQQQPESFGQPQQQQLGGEEDNILSGINQYQKDVKNLELDVKAAGKVPSYLAARGAVGYGKGIIGLPASVNKLLNFASLGKVPVSKLLEKIEDLPEKALIGLFGEDVVKKAPKGWENAGEFAEDAATLLSPGMLLKAAATPFKVAGAVGKYMNAASKVLGVAPKTALAISAAGNVPKWLAKKTGLGEGYQSAAKIGGTLAFGLLGPRMFSKQLQAPESQALKGVEDQVKTSFKSEPGLMDAWNMYKGKSASGLKGKELGNFRNIVQNPRLRNYLEKYSSITQEHKELKSLANEGSFIGKWGQRSMMRRIGQGLFSAAAALFIAPSNLPARLGVFAGAGASIWSASNAEKVIRLAYKSPAFRSAYGATLQGVVRQSASTIDKSLRKLNRIMVHEGIEAPQAAQQKS